MSIVFQTLGGAFTLCAAQAAFVNRLLSTAAKTVPTVDPIKLIGTGATEIRTIFPADEVPGIVLAYMAGLKLVFALIIATTGTALVASFLADRKKLYPEELKDAGAAG
jgi:hypothetical protein